MNPAEEPWQKENRELREKFEMSEAERAKDSLKRQLVEKAALLKVNPFFIEDYLPPSLEVGELFLQKIKAHDEEMKKATVNELVASGYKPKSGDSKDTRKLDLTTLTQEEAIRLEMEGKLDDQIEM